MYILYVGIVMLFHPSITSRLLDDKKICCPTRS